MESDYPRKIDLNRMGTIIMTFSLQGKKGIKMDIILVIQNLISLCYLFSYMLTDRKLKLHRVTEHMANR